VNVPSSQSGGDPAGRLVYLLREHEEHLRAFVLTLVPHWADADEIVQLTRIRIWEQFDQYDPAKDFGAWARTIAFFLVRTHRKNQTRHPKLRSPEFLEAVAQRFEREVPRAGAFTRALAMCLQKLDEGRRKLVMRYYGGRGTIAEVASEMGLSTNAVQLRIRRARLALSECVEAALKEEVE